MIKYYDIHYFEDLANLEYCTSPDDLKTEVYANLLYKLDPEIFEYKMRSWVDNEYKLCVEPSTYLTDLGVIKVRELLRDRGILPLHMREISFTDMVNIYNKHNPDCVRDIGDKWEELNSIEKKGSRFLRYRDLSERELNTQRLNINLGSYCYN